jgi:hypothetical protein
MAAPATDAKGKQPKAAAAAAKKGNKPRPVVVPVIPLALMPRRAAAQSSQAAAVAAAAAITPTPTATVPSTPISAKAGGTDPAAGIVSPLTSDEPAPSNAPPSALHTPTSIPATAVVRTDEDSAEADAAAVATDDVAAVVAAECAADRKEKDVDEKHSEQIKAATTNAPTIESESRPAGVDTKHGALESTTPSSMESPPTNTTSPMAADPGALRSQAPPELVHELAAAAEPHHAPHHQHHHDQQASHRDLDAHHRQNHHHVQHPHELPGLPHDQYSSEHRGHYEQHHHEPRGNHEHHNHPEHHDHRGHPHGHHHHHHQEARHDHPMQQHDFHPYSMGAAPPYAGFHAARNGIQRPNRVAPLAHMFGPAKGPFDGFPDSPISPSPGPPFGGIAPPPGFMIDGPPMHRPGPAPLPGHAARQDSTSSVDRLPRQMPGFPPPPQMHAGGTHSFHGSQGSIHDDVLGPPPPVGFDGPGIRGMAPPPPPPPGYMMPHPSVAADTFADANSMRHHVRSQFRDPAFSDCQLALVLPSHVSSSVPPPLFPGHAIILARSPALKDLLIQRAHGSTVRLQTDDKNVRPDAFDAALHHLYGYELLNPLAVAPLPAKGGLGLLLERFDYALAYAASGHLLCWEPVTTRGMEIAAHHLDWPVIERALDFILSSIPFRGAIDRQSQLPYGGTSSILVRQVVDFLIRAIPAGFTLDTTIPDPDSYARLPNLSASPSSQSRQPPIARGSSMPHPHHRQGRLQGIKFGDMAPSSPLGSPSHPPPVLPAVQATLSRVLLNLPFIFLQPVLENFGLAPEWGHRDARRQIVFDVLGEREARRCRALDAVVDGRVPSAVGIQRGLQSLQARSVDEWDVLCWAEQISSVNEMGIASLVRSWSPLRPTNYEEGTAMFP